MFSLEAQARHERAEAVEKEREEVGLALRDTRSRVKKYDRLKKRIKTKVHVHVACCPRFRCVVHSMIVV